MPWPYAWPGIGRADRRRRRRRRSAAPRRDRCPNARPRRAGRGCWSRSPATSLSRDQHAGRDHRDERGPPLWAHAREASHNEKSPPEAGSPTARRGWERYGCYGVGDVAVEALFRNVPAPLPLSDQWCQRRPWCGRAVLEVERAGPESVKHENVALGPKNVAMQTSVKPQSAGHVAFGSNVPPVTLPRRKPWKRPFLPATTVEPCGRRSRRRPGSGPRSSGTCRGRGGAACSCRRGSA